MEQSDLQEILDRDVRAVVHGIALRYEQLAVRLRGMAARDADLYDPTAGTPLHHRLVSNVLAEIRGTQGNTMLDRLVESAAAAELEAVAHGYVHEVT